MHIEFLVEEASAEVALYSLVPRIIGEAESFDIHAFGGKKDLLSKLPSRMRAYRKWIPENWRIVVLIDEDRQDCHRLKEQLEEVARRSNFTTKSTRRGDVGFEVLNRLAIEELEAWFFGDVEALREAYPGLPEHLNKKRRFRDPDAIGGGTWEALDKLLRDAGYFPGGMPKIEVARTVSSLMNPDRNASKSFQVFKDGLRALVL